MSLGPSLDLWGLHPPWSLPVSFLLVLTHFYPNPDHSFIFYGNTVSQTIRERVQSSSLCLNCLALCCAGDVNHIRFVRIGFGAAYGTAKSGVGIASMGVMRPELVMKSIVPVVMAGVLGIYGLIISVIISTGSKIQALLQGSFNNF